MKKYKAFTLIELLIVISIIGILASVVLVSLSGAREKALNVKYKSYVSQVTKLANATVQSGALDSIDISGSGCFGDYSGDICWGTSAWSTPVPVFLLDAINTIGELPPGEYYPHRPAQDYGVVISHRSSVLATYPSTLRVVVFVGTDTDWCTDNSFGWGNLGTIVSHSNACSLFISKN